MEEKARQEYLNISADEMKNIMDLHHKYLNLEVGGKQADFLNCDLSGFSFNYERLSFVNFNNTKIRHASFSHADLSYATFGNAEIEHTDFYHGDLASARFSDAKIVDTSFISAYAHNCKLVRTELLYCNIRNANFSDACLEHVKFEGCRLENINFHEARLADVDFDNLCLDGVNFANAKIEKISGLDPYWESRLNILPEGGFYGYKKLCQGRIAKLYIPADAKRSNGTGRKCRAEYAKVIWIKDALGNKVNQGVSIYCSFHYYTGQIAKPNAFDTNKWEECSNGIHFFLTEEEARNYN